MGDVKGEGSRKIIEELAKETGVDVGDVQKVVDRLGLGDALNRKPDADLGSLRLSAQAPAM